MDNEVVHEYSLIESSQCQYTPEELILLNPTQCIAAYDLIKKIPKKIVTCCGVNECNYHKIFPTKSKTSTVDDNITSEKRNLSTCSKKVDGNEQPTSPKEQLLPDEIIIAELSDVSESERSAEHFQHCCIHKNNVKISFEDLVRYKTRKTQPPYLAHENAVVNPKRIINREHLENIISSKSSEQIPMYPKKQKNLPRDAPDVNHELIIPTNPNETPFSRIVKKIKEKGLVPKPVPQSYQNLKDGCPIHRNCCSDNNSILPINQSALTDNFHNALSMFPSVLRRKIMAMSEATSTSSDTLISGTTTTPIVQEGFQTPSAVTIASDNHQHSIDSASIKGKTVVPVGTLEKILNSKYNNQQVIAHTNQCDACTCQRERCMQPYSAQYYQSNTDEIIDLRQLERLQLSNESHHSFYNNVYNNAGRRFSTGVISSTENKENRPSNEQDNLNFKNLVKQALTKPGPAVKGSDHSDVSRLCNDAKQQQ